MKHREFFHDVSRIGEFFGENFWHWPRIPNKLSKRTPKILFLFSSGEKVDFQMAAAAIDGATKIWSCKVDAMHKEATQAVKGKKN